MGPTPSQYRPQALSVASGHSVASVSDFEARAANRGLDLSNLWSAHGPDGALLTAVLAVPSPGRTASVLFPASPRPEVIELTGRVLDYAARDLATGGRVALLQSLPRPGEEARARTLAAGGFQRLARLDYMERTNAARPSAASRELPEGFTMERWNPRDDALLMDLLRRTFEGTLDCPGLADMRTDRDILEGHLANGDGDTSMWSILRLRGRPAGAMLLSPCGASESVDLIYLGLVPEARAMGVGSVMLALGLEQASRWPARLVQLAVDIANVPAVRLYQHAGFVARQQREAWVRSLSSDASCPQ